MAGALAWAVLAASGCAPARFTEGLGFEAQRQGVRDASASVVRGKGHLRFDAALRADLDEVIAQPELDAMRQASREVLRAAAALALRSAQSELERMPAAGLRRLASRYSVSQRSADAAGEREHLQVQFAQLSREALAADLAAIDAAASRSALLARLNDLRRRIAPGAGDAGRLGRVLLAAPLYVPATIGAELADAGATQRTTTARFDHTRLYVPATSAPPGPTDLQNADMAELAQLYAPLILQEVNPQAEYAAREDRIGCVKLSGSPNDIVVHIDDTDPAIYWAHAQARVDNRRYDQLIYVGWYPSRPALSAGDPQAGRIDGVVVRITLDRRRRPAVYEFVRTCGCYHTLWVAEFVEQAAIAEFKAPLPDMAFAVQQRSRDHRDLFMPAIVPEDGTRLIQPVVMVDAGQHLVGTIATVEQGATGPQADERVTYRLEPYSNLTHLTLGDGIASMFGSDGLVHGAARAEGWMLAPTGMLQAGRPRQLGTMKIRMDAYDYDDPRLLERNLRLPREF